MLRLTLCGVFVTLLAGCGSETARVRGQLLENGQPLALPRSEAPAAIVLSPIGADGSPDRTKLYTVALSPDGSFELVASGGSVPPGTYQLSVEVPVKGRAGEKFKPFAGPQSPIRRELKPGQNDITIDLANPNG